MDSPQQYLEDFPSSLARAQEMFWSDFTTYPDLTDELMDASLHWSKENRRPMFRFDSSDLAELDSGRRVATLTNAELRTLAQKAWNASQAEDLRKLRREAALRCLTVA